MRTIPRRIWQTTLVVVAIGVACKRYPLGRLSVEVVDEKNEPVSGVAADLFRVTSKGRIYWRASRTGMSGKAIFGEKNGGVIEGEYIVGITLMPWQKLAPGQAQYRNVSLKKGDDVVLVFRVIPRRPVRPSPQLSP